MALVPLVLAGNLEEKEIAYNFGVAYPISKGTWELAIKTLIFEYKKKDPENPDDKDPPSFNKFLFLSCNYVEEPRVINGAEIRVEPSVLCSCHLIAKAGAKKIINFETRDFFRVSAPTKKFTISITDHHGEELHKEIRKKLNLSVLLLFRRTT